jgi:hypothetical protein
VHKEFRVQLEQQVRQALKDPLAQLVLKVMPPLSQVQQDLQAQQAQRVQLLDPLDQLVLKVSKE